MNRTITILLLLFSLNGISQNNDYLDLTGNWYFEYYVNTDSAGNQLDTFFVKSEVVRAYSGLKITENTSDEFWEYWDYPSDSTAYFGAGEWEIYEYNGELKISFDCDGMMLCGTYEFVSLENDLLILQSCSKYDYEGCELDHFVRRAPKP